MKFTFTIATANSQNTPDLPRRKVVEIARSVNDVHVACFQEIREGEDVKDTRKGLGPDFHMLRQNTSTPIALTDEKFTVLDDKVLLFHQAHGRIPTPRRQGVAALLKPKRHPMHKPIVVINVHMINGAFNGNHPDTEEARRVLWYASYDVLERAIEEYYRLGYHVIVLGDFNRQHVRPFHRRFKWPVDGGIDKIGVLAQPGWHIDVSDVERINNPSDHHAIKARVTVRRR